MAIKTGVDIIDVGRIQKSIEKHGNKFLERVFTKKEIEYCESKNIQRYQSYAGRFAAKEAVFKCLSCYLENKFEIEWKDIEILNDKNGRPYVCLYGNFNNFINEKMQIDISISHIREMAIANCVVLNNME